MFSALEMNIDAIEKMFILIEFIQLKSEKLVVRNSFNTAKHKNMFQFK